MSWCWYCNAQNIAYCKGGDEQGRCRFHDNPVTKQPSDQDNFSKLLARTIIVPTERDITLWALEAETHLKFGGVSQLGKFNWPQAVLSLIAELEKKTNDTR